MQRLSGMDLLFLILLVVGGINWGLVGLAGIDLVASLFGSFSAVSRVVYVLVGIAALYILFRSLGRREEMV